MNQSQIDSKSMLSGAPTPLYPLLADSEYNEDQPGASKQKSMASVKKNATAPAEEDPLAAKAKVADDQVENNTDKSIDFAAQLSALKRRTEADLPYTLTQVEDAMYLDQNSIVTLEYHYYQNDCQYTKLQPCEERYNENDVLVDQNDQPVKHSLATEKFQPPHEEPHPMSGFNREDIVNLIDSKVDIIKRQKYLPQSEFMRVENQAQDSTNKDDMRAKNEKRTAQQMALRGKKDSIKKDDSKMVEAIIAFYKVTAIGGMQRINEVEVKMGRKFFPSQDGNMTLTRSKDKKIISLVNFNEKDKLGNFFKVLAWTCKLKAFNISEKLNEGMNQYFRYIQKDNTFDKLVEVSFVGNSKYVQLIYIEKQERSMEEKQAYEKEIDEIKARNGGDKNKPGVGQESFQKRSTPRKARKYVFFEIATGLVVFQYGGVNLPMEAIVKRNNGNDESEIDVFEIGLLVKEIREEAFNPQLVFFFAGDFMDDEIKKQQIVFKWGLGVINIAMKDIFCLETQEAKIDLVQDTIRDFILSQQLAQIEYYPFDNDWIEQQRFNWQMSITPAANRKFDQYAFINFPQDPNEFSQCTYYVHGPKFKDMLDQKSLKQSNYILDVPYFAKLPSDAIVQHSRNSLIKDQMFYDIIRGGEIKNYCLRLDHADPKCKVMSPRIPINQFVSQVDVWLHYKKNYKDNTIDEMFQTVHVAKGDQAAVLQTKVPAQLLGIQNQDYEIVKRDTSMFQDQQADLPVIAYNLGDTKLVMMNTLQTDQKTKFILQLEQDEKFVCFVQFNQFEDIGFYPKNLRIECCSHFCFMSTKINNQGVITDNVINLILMDPFYKETQVAHFRSCSHFDNEIFRSNDVIIKSVIQSTMGKKRDRKFKTYIWTQFPNSLIRSGLLRQSSNKMMPMEDSDNEDPLEMEAQPEDEESIGGKRMMETIPVQMNGKDFMYYITKKNGMCDIMEGNPRDQYINNHVSIYSIKAEKCLAFSVEEGDTFYFMDESHVVYKMTRNENNRFLNVVAELTMKEIQRLDFKPKPFEQVFLKDKYTIQGSKIFYLYNLAEDPFPEGVYEAEELIQEDRSKPKSEFTKGPLLINGSNRFYNIYRINKFQSHIRIFLKPDSTQKVLINDFLNWVDMSTYLEDGKILIKIRRRFMVFTCDGAFLGEISFDDANISKRNSSVYEGEIASEYRRYRDNLPVPKDAPNFMSKRKGKEPILDFLGNPFDIKQKEPAPPLSDNNKMELLQMSYNNRYYLFLNRMTCQLLVYELVEKKSSSPEIESWSNEIQQLASPQKSSFTFECIYDLCFENAGLFQHIMNHKTLNVDPIEYYRKNLSQVKINDAGKVQMCFVENLPYVEDDGGDEDSDSGPFVPKIQCRIVGSLFEHDKEGTDKMGSKISSFSHVFTFPKDAQQKLNDIVEGKKSQLERKIKNIRLRQQRLPKKLFDYSQYENLLDDLVDLEDVRSDLVYAKIYYENLVVVYCGQYLKYGFLKKSKKKASKGKAGDKHQELVLENASKGQAKILDDIAIHFSSGVEVVKVQETQMQNWLQILTKDHDEQIMKIITWDFNQNMEQSCLQMTPNYNCEIGQHLVKGMNYKMNYFLDAVSVTDLEYNIPLRQVNVDQGVDTSVQSYSKQNKMINEYFNQRKIYQDQQRFLGIEKACCLYYPLSRMDILLWHNINVLGENKDVIRQTCTLQQINLVFDGISLFHYFADNAEVIEEFRNRFINEKTNSQLQGTDETLPLQILNPDNDGYTALFLALSSQSPRSFECMIEMLSDFPQRCLTKMMLKSLAVIVSHDSDMVIEFFDKSIYQPPQMQIEQFVPWSDDLSEEGLIFASHTSIISRQLLLEKLEDQGITESRSSKKGANAQEEEEAEDQTSKRQKILQKRKQLRDFTLPECFDDGLEEGETPLQRVQIEALDMDWIFIGDNAQTMLAVLSGQAQPKALKMKAIKTFISLMWKHYQDAIIKNIFIPYAFYLVALSYLAGGVCGEFILLFYEDDIVKQTEEYQQQYLITGIKAYFLTAVSTACMFCFGSLEMGQMAADGFGYFTDYWNCIDATSLSLNTVFLGMFTVNCIFQNEYFKIELLYSFGGFATFFMWIKVFYWMRLFSALAYYVKLIQQTIADSMYFMLMVLIIINAFANFFYVINKNQELSGEKHYYDSYTKNSVADVIISVYMLGALGDFDSTIYRIGYDKYFALSMFLLATFIISVVFMNMLIAIMGETFGSVTDEAEESGLNEQVILINDHAWLLDLKEIFKGQKYIISVNCSNSGEVGDDVVVDKVKETENIISKKINRLQSFMQKRIDGVDLNTRFLLKFQQLSIENATKKIKSLEKIFKQAFEKADNDEDANLTDEQKLEKVKMTQKKNSIIQALNAQTSGQSLTIEAVQEIALNWMEIADTDGSGELDYHEFHDFFSKIEGVMVTDDEIKQIFEDFDGSGNGSLSVEEFARAIYQAVLADMDDYSQNEEMNDDYGLEEESGNYQTGNR